MSGTIHKLELVEVGEGFRFDANQILDAAKDQPFSAMAVIGQLEDGEFYIAGNCNAGETLIMLERVKLQLIGQ